MGFLSKLFGKKKPVCASCGRGIDPSGKQAELHRQQREMARTAQQAGIGNEVRDLTGKTFYQGVICQRCEKMFCLRCYNPLKNRLKCPDCGASVDTMAL